MIVITDEEMDQAERIRAMEHFPMNSYYVTGDCHGDFRRIEFFCRKWETSKKDYMIILGDAGINYWLDERDRELKKSLSELPISFLMIHGNHEERPYCIPSYVEKEWHGGIVYYEEEFPDILFAGDGEIYDLDGVKAIVIGGAYSVDKDFRVSVGLPWFANEQPSAPVKSYVEEQLKKHDWTVDYVFSHTCPLFMEPRELFAETIDRKNVDSSMLYEEIRELGIIPETGGMIPGLSDFRLEPCRPLYRQGEYVMFMDGYGEDRVGRIVVVNDDGAKAQMKEVSYDIEVGNKGLFRHIPESWVERF